MRYTTPSELQETARRLEAAIGKASVRHMGNAKWRKLFETLWPILGGRVLLRWKFVGDARIFNQPCLSPADVWDATIGDELPSPGTPYREIEWLEIPLEHADRVEQSLALVGKYPLVRGPTGIRVIGYEW